MLNMAGSFTQVLYCGDLFLIPDECISKRERELLEFADTHVCPPISKENEIKWYLANSMFTTEKEMKEWMDGEQEGERVLKESELLPKYLKFIRDRKKLNGSNLQWKSTALYIFDC
jgi:hypothetical protein